MLLKDQIVLVTGASRGIGKAVADSMAAQGAAVVGTATSEQGAAAIAERLGAAAVPGTGMKLDVTNQDEIKEVVAAISEQYGAVSVLINNAGITKDNLFMRMKDDEWDSIVDTNLSSIFRVSKACIKPMVKARFGRIINISSVVGLTGNPGQTNYAASKAGIIGFGKSLARELGSRGITVNAIAPGFIVSDMTDALEEEQREQLAANISLGRFGEAQEVADAAVFLASPMASYITGQTLHVNGGMYMP